MNISTTVLMCQYQISIIEQMFNYLTLSYYDKKIGIQNMGNNEGNFT